MLDAVERSTRTLEKLDFEVLSLRAEALEKERDMEKCPGSLNFFLVSWVSTQIMFFTRHIFNAST